ncbi:MAG: hypothetical protein U0903_16380 [Planctomycetales bacterium]
MTRPRSGPGWGTIFLRWSATLALLLILGRESAFSQSSPAAPAQPPPVAPATPAAESAPAPRVYVPYKSLSDVLGNSNPTIFLPLKEFEALWEKVRTQIPPLPASAALTGATYTATATPQTLTVTGELSLQSTAKSWSRFPLDFGAGKLAAAKWSDPRLILHNNSVGQPELLIPAPGSFTGNITVVYSVEELQAQHIARLKLPSAAASTLDINMATADQVFRTEPALPLSTSSTPQSSTAKITLGRTTDVQLSWSPKNAPATPVDRLLTAERITRISLQQGTALTNSETQLQILRGTVNQLRIALPLNHQLVDVTAPGLKSWNIQKEDKRQILLLDFSPPLAHTATLHLRTEFPFTEEFTWGGVDSSGKAQGIEILDLHREQGMLILQAPPDTSLNVDSPQGLVRIGIEEVPPLYRKGDDTFFRFFSAKHQLKVTAKPIEPRVLVKSRTRVLIGTDEARLLVNLAYKIERAGLFSLSFKLPAGMKIDSVQCPDLQDQTLSPQGDLLKLTLAQRKLGELSLNIEGRIPRDPAKTSLIAPLIEPQNVAFEEGVVTIEAPDALEIVTDPKAIKAAQPITANEEPQNGFRNASAWSFNHRPVEIPLSISRKPPRLTAQTATTLNLRQKILELSTLLKLQVDYSGVRQFQFLLPESIGSTLQIEELDGSRGLIKQKTSAKSDEAGWNLWTIETQREVLGPAQFRLRYDIPLQEAAGVQLELKLPRLLIPAAAGRIVPAAVGGEVAVVKDEAWSLTTETSGLESIDVRELQQLPQAAAIAYRYFETSGQPLILKLMATKYETRDVIQTIISRALVEGVLTFEDQGLFRCRFRLTTSERQRLPVQLPAQVEPLSVSVAGQQVPLERSADAKTRGRHVFHQCQPPNRRRSAFHDQHCLSRQSPSPLPPRPGGRPQSPTPATRTAPQSRAAAATSDCLDSA